MGSQTKFCTLAARTRPNTKSTTINRNADCKFLLKFYKLCYCRGISFFQPTWRIRNGNATFPSFQIYSLDDVECSELCSCGDSLTLTCHALCVPFAPCRTALAFYSHASPAYQAFRGRCLCYSGRFICMKPPLGEYILPGESLSFTPYIPLISYLATLSRRLCRVGFAVRSALSDYRRRQAMTEQGVGNAAAFLWQLEPVLQVCTKNIIYLS